LPCAAFFVKIDADLTEKWRKVYVVVFYGPHCSGTYLDVNANFVMTAVCCVGALYFNVIIIQFCTATAAFCLFYYIGNVLWMAMSSAEAFKQAFCQLFVVYFDSIYSHCGGKMV